MKKYTVYYVVAGVAIVALLGWLFYPKPATPVPTSAATMATTTTPIAASEPMPSATPKAASVPVKAAPKAAVPALPGSNNTYKSLFSQPGAHECDYTEVTKTGVNNDSIFIANGKMYGQFLSSSSVGTNMVYDGTYLYTWTEGEATGTRTPLTSLSQLPVVIPPSLTGGGSYGASGAYGSTTDSVSWQCHPWIPDPKVLVPPSYVHFSS